jgi:serine/threonine-protein kinase
MDDLKKCSNCGKTYSSNLSFCLDDGSPLVQMETLVGTVLDGRYRLDSLIGVGGMGDVYRATHVHLDTEFAVKLLKPEFVANQTAIKRFRLEAKAAGRIHHPNAVRVTDFGVTAERIVYLVMELVNGVSLRSMMRNEGKFEFLRTVNIVRQVCGAVDAAHRGGVIHRDLKPDNILIENVHNVERVKVLDFGIAKLKEAKTDAFLTQAGTIIGTPQYMSPEQCQGKHLDPMSDIYSIGIILYEMLTTEVPFDGESTLQVVYNQLHQPPRPIREIAPDVPPLLAQVVMRALEKEPDHRQASAIQLSDELRDAVEASGEGDFLSITNPLVVQPIAPNAARTGSREIPFANDLPPGASRETTAISRPSGETDVTPTRVEMGRSTASDGKARTAERSADHTREYATSKSRLPLIAGAAIVLVMLAAALIYFATRETIPAPPPQPPKGPEGMVYIPGGKFVMGRSDGAPDEGPAHEVEVKPFFLDITEVTNQEYKRFVDATGYRGPFHWKQNGSYVPDEARYPVTYVTWDDATAYAKWANKRLPREAEWEYAARGGDKGLRYPWGNEWQPGAANLDRKAQNKPAPVRSFEKDISPFGVYDMAGNVSEWVQDFYSNRYGASPDQRLRVYRGGNFVDPPENSTNTYRWADFPTNTPNNQIFRVGFRCAKDIE